MVIRDARVLKEEFVPDELRHRDAELGQLTRFLAPLEQGEVPDTVLIHGPSGAGKTALSRYTLEQLEREVLDLRSTYINCWEDYNRYRVLYRALEGIGKTLDVHRQSTPKDELLARLRRSDDAPYVLILDEVDQLEDQKVLYDLYRMEHVAVVMIANTEESVFARMDDRVRSRLMGAERINFGLYGLEELVDILGDRAEWGLEPDAVDRETLEEIADAAAGDARLAISILRSAARRAEQDRADITPELVRDAVPDAEEATRRASLEKLNDHQRALYDILDGEGPLRPGDLYERYREEIDDPKTDRTLRNYLNKMEHYDLVESEGERRGKLLHARG